MAVTYIAGETEREVYTEKRKKGPGCGAVRVVELSEQTVRPTSNTRRWQVTTAVYYATYSTAARPLTKHTRQAFVSAPSSAAVRFSDADGLITRVTKPPKILKVIASARSPSHTIQNQRERKKKEQPNQPSSNRGGLGALNRRAFTQQSVCKKQ